MLVSAYKAAGEKDGGVVLLRPSGDVRALIELTRMHEVFEIYGDEQAAVEQLGRQTAA